MENCDVIELIEKENYYINLYESNNHSKGYNLATVNEFRRNTFNEEVKIKLSKYNLHKNGNLKIIKLTNIKTGISVEFDNLVEAANYLINNNYAKGKNRNVRMKLSYCLRGKKVNNGGYGSVRKTAYKHKFEITI